jgi:hypothetical protein
MPEPRDRAPMNFPQALVVITFMLCVTVFALAVVL